MAHARRLHAALGVFAALAILGHMGCMTPKTTTHRSGLMEYLYPARKDAPIPNPAGAQLQLPLRLGLAFVPSGGGGWRAADAIPAGTERPLLDIVKGAFKDKTWVSEIKVIPSTYLMPGGGFRNLDQVSRMYGVDVIALVSVDQIQYTDPKWYSFAYLSVVGAYVLPGEKNDTRTLIDAAIFHIPSRTFLLRAPGQSIVKGSSTPISLEARLREDAGKGLDLAMRELAKNMAVEVESFKTDVATGGRKDVDVVDQKGQSLRATGGRNFGGAFGGAEVLAGLALVAAAALRRRRS